MGRNGNGYKQGFFTPKFPGKYIGNAKNIVFRSGWEYRVMRYLDENTTILKWGSEELPIPYVSPLDNRIHHYYVDFYVEARGKDGQIRKMLLEVKPKAQTMPPEKPKRRTKRYLMEVATYGINQAKWEAANEFCLDHGWEFRLITESELFPKKRDK